MTPNGADPRDLEAVLRLGAGTLSTDPRRRHAVNLVRACGSEPPPEWFAEILAPAAWHLVADVLSAAPAGTVVEHGEHSGGQHQDIVIWHAEERWPRIFITWTSGRLCAENTSRALDRDYAEEFVGNHAALACSVRSQFHGAVPGSAASSIAGARLIACLTEPPSGLATRLAATSTKPGASKRPTESLALPSMLEGDA